MSPKYSNLNKQNTRDQVDAAVKAQQEKREARRKSVHNFFDDLKFERGQLKEVLDPAAEFEHLVQLLHGLEAIVVDDQQAFLADQKAKQDMTERLAEQQEEKRKAAARRSSIEMLSTSHGATERKSQAPVVRAITENPNPIEREEMRAASPAVMTRAERKEVPDWMKNLDPKAPTIANPHWRPTVPNEFACMRLFRIINRVVEKTKKARISLQLNMFLIEQLHTWGTGPRKPMATINDADVDSRTKRRQDFWKAFRATEAKVDAGASPPALTRDRSESKESVLSAVSRAPSAAVARAASKESAPAAGGQKAATASAADLASTASTWRPAGGAPGGVAGLAATCSAGTLGLGLRSASTKQLRRRAPVQPRPAHHAPLATKPPRELPLDKMAWAHKQEVMEARGSGKPGQPEKQWSILDVVETEQIGKSPMDVEEPWPLRINQCAAPVGPSPRPPPPPVALDYVHKQWLHVSNVVSPRAGTYQKNYGEYRNWLDRQQAQPKPRPKRLMFADTNRLVEGWEEIPDEIKDINPETPRALHIEPLGDTVVEEVVSLGNLTSHGSFYGDAGKIPATWCEYFAACRKLRVTPKPFPALLDDDLTTLSVPDRCLLEDDLLALIEALKVSKQPLEVLDISGNPLTPTSTEQIGPNQDHIRPVRTKSRPNPDDPGPNPDDPGSAVMELVRVVPLRQLRSFSLERLPLGLAAITLLADLINETLSNLVDLSFAGVQIPEDAWVGLHDPLRESRTLMSLNLQNTGIFEHSQQGMAAITDIVGKNRRLKTLDLSWNTFGHSGYLKLGAALAENYNLLDLDLSNTNSEHTGKRGPSGDPADPSSGAKATGDPEYSPVLGFLEAMRGNYTLASLRLQQCSLEYSADSVLRETFEEHPDVTELDLSSNPHGELGIGVLFRLALNRREVSDVPFYIRLDGCRECAPQEGAFVLDLRRPTGLYKFDLSHVQHRSALRQLCAMRPDLVDCATDSSVAEEAGLAEEARKKVAQKKPVSAVLTKGKDARGRPVFTPAQKGELEFMLPPKPPPDINSSVEAFVHAYMCAERKAFTLKEIPTISGFIRSLSTIAGGVEMLFRTMADEFIVRIPQAQVLRASCPKTSRPAVSAHLASMVQILAPTEADWSALLQTRVFAPQPTEQLTTQLLDKFLFNPTSATGRYTVDLSTPMGRAIVQQARATCRFDAQLAEKHGVPDLSQYAPWEGFRNATWNGDKLLLTSDTRLPTSGILGFDYFPAKNMHPHISRGGTKGGKASQTDDCLVERLLASVLVSQVGWPQKIKALRFVSSRFLMSISQINTFVDCVEQAEDVSDRLTSHKVDMLIALYNCAAAPDEIPTADCIYDGYLTEGPWDPKQCAFSKAEVEEICVRVGPAAFDPQTFHRANPQFNLGLHLKDDWVMAKLVLTIASKEPGGVSGNVADVSYSTEEKKEDGEEEEEMTEIPSSWVTAPPKSGRLRFIYKGTDVTPEMRAGLAMSALGWSPHVHERQRRGGIVV